MLMMWMIFHIYIMYKRYFFEPFYIILFLNLQCGYFKNKKINCKFVTRGDPWISSL